MYSLSPTAPLSPSPSPSPSSAVSASSPLSAADLHAVSDGFSALQSFTLWESRTLLVIVGADRTGRACRLMQMDRTTPLDINLQEDPTVYPSFALAERAALMQIQASGCPLDRTLKFAALLGFLRLPKVFLVLVIRRDRVGSIGGRWLYTVADWKLKALGHKSYDNKKNAPVTAKYKALILSDIEMSRDFFFSYFYDITHTLQHNLLAWKADKQKREAAEAEANKAQKEKERAENEKRARAALAAAASAAASAAVSPPPVTAVVVEAWDPEAFDPIANDQPQNRRRSTSHIGGVAPAALPTLQPMQTLAEEDDETASPDKTADVESSSRSFDDAADLPSNPQLLNTASISSRSDRTLSARKLDSSSPTISTSVSYSAPPAVIDIGKPMISAIAPAADATPAAAPVAAAAAPAPVSAALHSAAPPAAPAYDEKWLWNLHHAREFLHVLPHGSYWLVPLIHGFCQQHAVRVGRKDVLVTLIARRSRHFAGTRFIKRGVSSLGHVANEVETEQIVCERHAFSEGMGAFSSVVMLRGSIPLYWAQENPKSPKPDIVVYNFDRDFVATKLHLTELFARYGSPIAMLSLIKTAEKSPQETRLGMAFHHAIQRVQAQFRMEKLIKEMADQTFSAAGVQDAFVKEQDKKDRMAAMQAAIHAKDTLPFPAAAAAAAPAPTAQQSLMAQEAAFAESAPPYCHPSYDPNTLLYCTYDFLGQRHRQQNVLKELRGLVSNLVEEIGVFTFVSAKPTDTRFAPEPVVSVAGALQLAVPLAANSTPLQAAMLSSNAEVNPGLPLERSVLSTQKGVIRVNCIDCLDRTNVGQFTIGKAAIKIQLRQLGIDDEPMPVPGVVSPVGPGGFEVYPELVSILQDMYTQHGDRIAHQYAGSGAMHKEILYDDDDGGADEASIGLLEEIDRGLKPAAASAGPGGPKAPSKNVTQNALSAIKRYYNNNFNDSDKQSAINVFLGNYIPHFTAGRPHIWEMDVYTNLLDSDTKFRVDGDRFRMPYLPQALGFIQRMRHVNKSGRTRMGIQASKITMAAIGSPMGSPSPSSPAAGFSSPSPRVSAAGGAGHARFDQFFNEAYDPTVYESFDDELKRAFQTAVTVKTAPLLMDPGKYVTIASASIGPQSSAVAGSTAGGASASAGVSSSSSVTNPVAAAQLPSITESDGDYVQIDTSSVGEAPPGAQQKPAPAAAAVAQSNPVKRGFTSLLQGARASISAVMAGSAPPAAAGATAQQKPPPMQGAAPPVARAVQQPRSDSPVTDGSASGVTSLDSLLQQQQRQEQMLKAATARAATAPAPASIVVCAPPPSTAAASSSSSSGPVSLSSFPEIPGSPLPPARSESKSAAAAAAQQPQTLPSVGPGPSSFQTASTSSAMHTGWSPRVSQKRVLPFAVPHLTAMSSLDDAADEDESSLEPSYLRSAAEDVAVEAEYSTYCDTARLESTLVLTFGGPAPSAQLSRGGVDQARLADLLSKAVVGAGDPLPAPSAAEVSAVDLVGASLQLSHDQMATLLADNLRDIAALHAEARAAQHRVHALAAAAAPRSMLAAAPFVLAPLTPADSNSVDRRAEDRRAAFAILDKTN